MKWPHPIRRLSDFVGKIEIHKSPPWDLSPLLSDLGERVAQCQTLVSTFENRLNTHETMLAELVMAFVENFAAVELIIKTIIQDKDPEDQRKFLQEFAEFRANVLQTMQEISRSGLEGLDPETRRTLENVAAK